jgi:hypothetical protein
MKNINKYGSLKITKIILLLCVIFQTTLIAQTLQIDNVTVNGIPISNNTINFGDLTQVTLKFRVSFYKDPVIDLGQVSYVAGTNKCSEFTHLFSPQTLNLGQNNTGFNDWREYTIYANDYPLQCGSSNRLRAVVIKTSGNVTYYSNEIMITKNPRFTLVSSKELVNCNENVTFSVNNLDNISASYQWVYDQSKWQTITTGGNNIVLKPISAPLSAIQVIVNANGTNYNLYKSVNFAPFRSLAGVIGNINICTGTSRTYNVLNFPSNQTISFNLSNTQFASITQSSQSQVTISGNANGVVNLIATITNQCNQVDTIIIPLTIGEPVIYDISSTGSFCEGGYQREQNKLTIGSDSNITQWQWHIGDNPGQIEFGQISIISGSNTNQIYLNIPNNANNGNVYVRARNSCGWSDWLYVGRSIENCSFSDPGCIMCYRTANSNTNKFNTIYIYPNPVKDELFIKLKDFNNNVSQAEETLIEIFDIQGKKVKNFTEINNNFSLDIRDLNKGIYLLKVQIKDIQETHKIIVE